MKIKVIWIVLVLIATPIARAQPDQCVAPDTQHKEFSISVNAALSTYKIIKVNWTCGHRSERYTSSEYVLDIRVSDTPVQVIEIDRQGIFGEPLFLDINFDGHIDLLPQTSQGGKAVNAGFQVWLFDPEEKRFEYAEALDGLSSPKVVPERREFFTTSHYGGYGLNHVVTTYQWIDGDPVKMERIHMRWDEEGNVVCRVQRRVSGQLVVVAERTTDCGDHDIW